MNVIVDRRLSVLEVERVWTLGCGRVVMKNSGPDEGKTISRTRHPSSRTLLGLHLGVTVRTLFPRYKFLSNLIHALGSNFF